jgi:hypothetical protein
MREPRTAVMTMVEASWQDESGALRTLPACMEVKSAGGACIRLKTPIAIGSKLSIRWRFDTFTGTARNCRSEGREYLVGIQRDGANTPLPSPPAPTVAPVAEPVRSSEPQLSPAAAAAAWTARMRSLRTPQEIKRQESNSKQSTTQETKAPPSPPPSPQPKTQRAEIPPVPASPEHKLAEVLPVQTASAISPMEPAVVRQSVESKSAAPAPAPQRKAEAVPFVRIAGRATALLPRYVDGETRIRDGPGTSQSPRSEPARSTERQLKPPPQGKDIGKERKRMRPKWLGLASWQSKPDALSESRNGNRDTSGHSNDEREKENFMSHATAPIKRTFADPAGEDPATFQVDLLPMDDIYRAAGIMSPPKGYGIKKVVDMLNSEYVHALSKDMKRAAVLMALDAAGVPLNQLQQDARARQDALDSYEAAQRKQVEAEWARKTEENVQIQAELERVKAHHQARIARNLDAIEREKATFSNWLAIKQQETHSMLEASELCLKAPAPVPASKPEAGKPEPSALEASAAKSEAHANPASDPAKDLLADQSLAKAAAAGGSKPM